MRDGEWPRSRYWLCHFLHNRHERPAIAWDGGPRLPSALARPLADWLAWISQTHQESRRRLIDWAVRQCAADPAYIQSLRLFVKEEQHHAALIERLLCQRGWAGRPCGWKRAAARAIVRPLGLRFELSMLLLTEIAALTLSRLLLPALNDDAAARGVAAQITHDHQCHIAFHAERLTTEFADFNFARRNLRRWRLRGMMAAATAGIALHHGRLLRALGATRRRYAQACHEHFERVLSRMVPYRREQLLAVLLEHRQQPYAKPAEAMA